MLAGPTAPPVRASRNCRRKRSSPAPPPSPPAPPRPAGVFRAQDASAEAPAAGAQRVGELTPGEAEAGAGPGRDDAALESPAPAAVPRAPDDPALDGIATAGDPAVQRVREPDA